MKKILKNKKAYSIVVIIIIIGFLTVLTAGVFKLIMNEMKDNRTIGNYIKAYAGAESAQELALLEIKEKGYESDKERKNPINISTFLEETKNNKDVYIYYEKPEFKIEELKDQILGAGETVLIPLYYLDSGNSYSEEKINNLVITSSDPDSIKERISWNIISEDLVNKTGVGISGDGKDLEKGFVKIIENGEFILSKDKIKIQNYLIGNTFFTDEPSYKTLGVYNFHYLQMLNGSDSLDKDFKYTISTNSGGKFVNPITKIISTGESGDYRTNIETEIDFSKMNDFSKYSIFSP